MEKGNRDRDPEHADPEELLEEVLAEYSGAANAAGRSQAEKKAWAHFGSAGAVFISDMSGFSRTTRAQGICHFLALIRIVRPVVAAAIGKHGGLLLKCETDNCYAFFAEVDQAIAAAVEINQKLDQISKSETGLGKTEISIGIDFGPLLLIGEVEYYGDPVNTASKLGEDIAGESEILVTDRAMARATVKPEQAAQRRRTRISGIEIEYVCLDMADGSN